MHVRFIIHNKLYCIQYDILFNKNKLVDNSICNFEL